MTIHKLYTDGSHMFYAKVSGIGGYLLDDRLEKVFEFSEIIDTYTHQKDLNKHEIFAMERGLTLCLEHGITRVQCFSDDKQLCLISNIQDKNDLNYYISRNPHLQKVTSLIEHFEQIEFHYLPREMNKEADKLSRKKILERFPTGRVELEEGFQLEHLLFSEKMAKKQKEEFIRYRKSYKNFYLFDFQIDKNTGTKTSYHVRFYHAQKTPEQINHNLLGSIAIESKNWRQDFINFIALSLKSVQYPRIGLILHGVGHLPVEDIIKGKSPVYSKVKDAMENLSHTFNQFEEIVFYNDYAVIDSIFPKPVLDSQKTEQLNKDELIQAMKTLGEDTYQLGQRPELENYFPVRKNKPDNIAELQRKYFGQFLSIFMNEEMLQSSTVPVKIRRSNEEAGLIAKELRYQLEEKGIKFRK